MIAVGRIGDREGRYDRIMISDCKIIAVHGIRGLEGNTCKLSSPTREPMKAMQMLDAKYPLKDS